MKQVWHPWTEWECYRAGMFDGEVNMDAETAKAAYADFLRDIPRFNAAMSRVVKEWPVSCEHFLSNPNTNRIAWLGQAAMCIETGVPCVYRGGFNTMDIEERTAANAAADVVLQRWIKQHAQKNSQVHSDVESAGLFA